MLADLELVRSSVDSLLDTYFDTESLDLRRAGCTLRVRQCGSAVRPVLTFKGPARKRNGAKRRFETEHEIDSLPEGTDELRAVLRDLGLDRTVRKFGGLDGDLVAQPIGQLRNRRSRHRYKHGLHRLDLTWDALEFPTGPPELRLEVEASSELAERLLERAAAELLELYGTDDLVEPATGKLRELCEGLYTELLAA